MSTSERLLQARIHEIGLVGACMPAHKQIQFMVPSKYIGNSSKYTENSSQVHYNCIEPGRFCHVLGGHIISHKISLTVKPSDVFHAWTFMA
jgi:hypothetical protein